MTEDEAKTKWCPFGKTGNDVMCGMNRPAIGKNYQGLLDSCMCIASNCACWVWNETAEELIKSGATEQTGHCGLIK